MRTNPRTLFSILVVLTITSKVLAGNITINESDLLGMWNLEYSNSLESEKVEDSVWTFEKDGSIKITKTLTFSPKPMVVTDKYRIEDGRLKTGWNGNFETIASTPTQLTLRNSINGGYYHFTRKQTK